MQKAALYTCCLLFSAAVVFHAVRLITGIEIVIGGIVVPQWGSYPAVLVAALLAAWMMIAARRI